VAAVAASRGVRTASSGTASTPSRRSTRIDTSEFIPGISAPSSLASRTSTGKNVTLCCTVARGSTFSTVPRKVRPGYASTVTRTCCPARTFPMSLSLTSVESYTVARSASVSSTVPPLGELTLDATTVPGATLRAITVPALGARMVTSSSAMRARSSCVRAAVSDDCALA
jgi:hypothetical protein